MGRKSRAKREREAEAEDLVDRTDASEGNAASGRRLAILWVIVLALPFLLLGGAELALRLGGYGHDREGLFVPSPAHPDFLQANPRVVTRFFTDPAQAPSVSIETAYFRRQKQAGTFRVFV